MQKKSPDKVLAKFQIVSMRIDFGMLIIYLSLSDILSDPLVCYMIMRTFKNLWPNEV